MTKLEQLHFDNHDYRDAAEVTEQIATEFAEWLQENRWFSFIDGKWNYTFEHGTAMSQAQYNKNYKKTSQELFQEFLKTK